MDEVLQAGQQTVRGNGRGGGTLMYADDGVTM